MWRVNILTSPPWCKVGGGCKHWGSLWASRSPDSVSNWSPASPEKPLCTRHRGSPPLLGSSWKILPINSFSQTSSTFESFRNLQNYGTFHQAKNATGNTHKNAKFFKLAQRHFQKSHNPLKNPQRGFASDLKFKGHYQTEPPTQGCVANVSRK